MKVISIYLAIAILAAPLVGQSGDRTTQQPGTRLVLVPSEPLTEPRFPNVKRGKTEPPVSAGSATRVQRVRPAILDLKPPGDPIYLVEEPEPEADQDRWRTHTRPKVEQFSRDGDGIAVQGYDVVSYLDDDAEKGQKEFSAEYGGTMWWFATAEHRDLFTRDPERYLPAYGGFCAYSVGKGYPATADPRVFAIDRGKLYLFFDKAVRAVWEQDRSRMVGKADRNWPKLHR
jgi:YHS domain-containing protein